VKLPNLSKKLWFETSKTGKNIVSNNKQRVMGYP
jgi:hypothetical protein